MPDERFQRPRVATKDGGAPHPAPGDGAKLPEHSERSPNELDQTDESQKAAEITEAGRDMAH